MLCALASLRPVDCTRSRKKELYTHRGHTRPRTDPDFHKVMTPTKIAPKESVGRHAKSEPVDSVVLKVWLQSAHAKLQSFRSILPRLPTITRSSYRLVTAEPNPA